MPKYILNGKLDIDPLISARNFLQKALREAKTELEIAGTIQAFEVSYWPIKLVEKYLVCRELMFIRPEKFFE